MHIPPNWGTFFALIVSFLVFWFIFSRLFFRPFLSVLYDRERRLKDLSDRTEQMIRDAKAADEERERRMAAVRRDALAQRDSERRAAETEAANMIEAAKADAHQTLEKMRAEIRRELSAAERELDAMARALAFELAERVLGRPLDTIRAN